MSNSPNSQSPSDPVLKGSFDSSPPSHPNYSTGLGPWSKHEQPFDLTKHIFSDRRNPIRSGGFGIVYKGRCIDSSHPLNHLDQTVAIKVIRIYVSDEQLELLKRV